MAENKPSQTDEIRCVNAKKNDVIFVRRYIAEDKSWQKATGYVPQPPPDSMTFQNELTSQMPNPNGSGVKDATPPAANPDVATKNPNDQVGEKTQQPEIKKEIPNNVEIVDGQKGETVSGIEFDFTESGAKPLTETPTTQPATEKQNDKKHNNQNQQNTKR